MADQDTLKIVIQTGADLRAAEQAKKTLEATRETLKGLGRDTAAVDKQIVAINTALNSEAAQAVKVAKAMRETIDATKSLGLDTKKLEADLKSLERQIGRTPLSLKSFKASFADVKQTFSDAGGGFGGLLALGTKLGPVAASVTAVIGTFLGLSKAVHKYADAEERSLKLQAALAQTGQLNDGMVAQVTALASALSTLTGISGGEWQDALRTLIQFGSTSSTLSQDAEAVKNLAGIMGGDLQGAAIAVAKSMAGNFTLLQRYGILTDENASKSERLRDAYEQLALRGGGQLEAHGKSLNGIFNQITQSGSKLLKSIGGIAVEFTTLRVALQSVVTAGNFWAKLVGSIVPTHTAFQNALVKTKQRAEEGTGTIAALADQYDNLSKSTERAAANLTTITAQIERQAQMQIEQQDAEAAFKIAQIDENDTLTPSQKIRAKQNIRRESDTRRALAQNKADEDIKGKDQARIETVQDTVQETVDDLTKDKDTVAALKRRDAARLEAENAKRAARKQLEIVGAAQGRTNAAEEAVNKDAGDVRAREELAAAKLDERNQRAKLARLVDVRNKANEAAKEADSKVPFGFKDTDAKVLEASIEERSKKAQDFWLKAYDEIAKLAEDIQKRTEQQRHRLALLGIKDATETSKENKELSKAERDEIISKKRAELRDVESNLADERSPRDRDKLRRDKVRIENEINTLEHADQPGRKAETEAENKKREADARKEAIDEQQKDHEKRFGKGKNSADTTAVERSKVEIVGEGQSLVAAITEMRDAFLEAIASAKAAAEDASAKADQALNRTDANRLS